MSLLASLFYTRMPVLYDFMRDCEANMCDVYMMLCCVYIGFTGLYLLVFLVWFLSCYYIII